MTTNQPIKTLFIPRIDESISASEIRVALETVRIGDIGAIQVFHNHNTTTNRIIITIKQWYSTRNAEIAQQRLANKQDIKIIYRDPWFWKIYAYKPRSETQQHKQTTPTIQQTQPQQA